MNYDLTFAIIFYALIFLYYVTHKHKFEVQGKIFVLYKTKLGLKLMDKIAKLPKSFFKFLGALSIIVGFVGMIGIFYILIKGTFDLIFVENAVPVIAPLLPDVSIPGLPTLSFWHWIFSILIVAIIHEFSHGILARAFKVKVKSSGFAFLGPILAAFVEPDEKQMPKESKFIQLSVFSAGPFSNVVTGFIFLAISTLFLTPFAFSMLDVQGANVFSVNKGTPADLAGLKEGDRILEINNFEINNFDNLKIATKNLKPGDEVIIKTETDELNLTATQHPKNASKGYLGFASTLNVGIKESTIKKYGNFFPSFIMWLTRLVEWLFLISLGIAFANLLPLGPVDGGRMALVGIGLFVKNQKRQQRIWIALSLVCLLLIIINLLPYLQRLLMFIFNVFRTLI